MKRIKILKEVITTTMLSILLFGGGYAVYDRYANYETEMGYLSDNKGYLTALLLFLVLLRLLYNQLNEK